MDFDKGDRVRVVRLKTTLGMLIAERYLMLRQRGVVGTVLGYVPGHGGDVWWVQQEDGVAAYSVNELKKVD